MLLPTEGSPLLKENRLYVVLHGLICLVDIGSNGYIAFILDMGDVHDYMYGNWLDEEAIPCRGIGQLPLIASLQGVDSYPAIPGSNDLDTSRNVVLAITKLPSLSNRKIRAVFNLPRPRNIYHFVEGGIPAGALSGADLPRIQGKPVLITSAKVFEYLLCPGRLITLTSDPPDCSTLWIMPDLSPTTDPNVAVATMHIYNEPRKTMDEDAGIQHGLDEFNSSIRLFELDVTLKKSSLPNTSAVKLPVGLLSAEAAPLDTRQDTVLGLAKAARHKDPFTDEDGGGTGGQICSGAHAVLTPISSPSKTVGE